MSCEKYEPMISAFLDGELSEEERVDVAAHLAACPGCQRYFDDLVAIHDALEQEEVPVPEDFAASVMARVRETPQEERRVIAFPRWKRWAALAACCALAALGLWTVQTGSAKTARQTMAARSAPELASAMEMGDAEAYGALPDAEAEVCSEEPDLPAEDDTEGADDAKRAMEDATEVGAGNAGGFHSDALAPALLEGYTAEKQNALSGTITAGGPAARAWVEEVLGLPWENGRTYLLTEEEFAGLADVLTAAGEDFRQESGEEGCRLLAEEAEE